MSMPLTDDNGNFLRLISSFFVQKNLVVTNPLDTRKKAAVYEVQLLIRENGVCISRCLESQVRLHIRNSEF